jgi:hypothetical protein
MVSNQINYFHDHILQHSNKKFPRKYDNYLVFFNNYADNW